MGLFFDENNKLVFSRYNRVWNDQTEITDSHALALIARMTLSGETPTVKRQSLINNCIVALKANHLFEDQWDVFVTTRGHGPNSTKMNWIKDASNATGTATFTTDVGYNSNGTSTYLNTNYTPSTQAVLYTKDSATFLIKTSGIIGNDTNHGARDIANVVGTIMGQSGYHAINSVNGYLAGYGYVAGYNAITRINSTTMRVLINSISSDNAKSSSYLTTVPFYVLRENYSIARYCAVTEKLEVYAMGKVLTQAQFLTFQTIMNDYFTSF